MENGDITISTDMKMFWYLGIIQEFAVLLALSYNNDTIAHIGVLFASILLLIVSTDIVLDSIHNTDILREEIVIREVLFVIALLLASMSFMDVTSAVILIVSTVIWGLGWQEVQYGKALYFP